MRVTCILISILAVGIITAIIATGHTETGFLIPVLWLICLVFFGLGLTEYGTGSAK